MEETQLNRKLRKKDEAYFRVEEKINKDGSQEKKENKPRGQCR